MTVDIFKMLGISDGSEVAASRRRLVELDAELAELRFRGVSRDNSVTAIVDGRGAIVEIVVRDAALRSAHPELVGPAVVEAVNQARAGAGQRANAAVQEVLHPGSTAPAATAPVNVSQRPSVATQEPGPARTSRGQSDDDDFGDYDFLALE